MLAQEKNDFLSRISAVSEKLNMAEEERKSQVDSLISEKIGLQADTSKLNENIKTLQQEIKVSNFKHFEISQPASQPASHIATTFWSE